MTADPTISADPDVGVAGAFGDRLRPFGLVVRLPTGTRLADLDAARIAALTEQHRVLVLRGVEPVARHELAGEARRLGPLLPWSFGAVNELRVEDAPKNYLYTERAVPLHWDGAFLGRPPRFLFFHCLRTPEAGGETTFVDTTRIWARASEAQRAKWRFLRFRYHTEKKVHYGGTFDAALVQHHPRTGEVVLRFAFPVDDLNPVSVEAIGLGAEEAGAALQELDRLLNDPAETLALPWKDGDYVVADNLTLLHGRRAFEGGARHLRRVNVLLDERGRWDWIWDSLRIRRPEFLVAEVPIALIPALLVAPHGELVGWLGLEMAALLLVLFHFGDMVNCLVDRHLDLTFKTPTAEAVWGLGPKNVRVQLWVTVALALVLAADLSFRASWWVFPGVAVGLLLGWAYSAPPLRLKARGFLQIPALAACIFIGPMLLVPAVWLPWPPLWLVAPVLAYAFMQEGIILVNTAEDLREDRAFGLKTSAVSLGAKGSLLMAAALIGVCGAGLLAWMVLTAPIVVALPFLLAWGWAVGGTLRAYGKARRSPDPEAVVRDAAKWVPFWISGTAWGTLLFAAWTRWG